MAVGTSDPRLPTPDFRLPTSDGDHMPFNSGLCGTCRLCRQVETGRSTFFLCERSFTDPRYRKYPVLPVTVCPGYEDENSSAPEAVKEST
jgi:hypothetical protein